MSSFLDKAKKAAAGAVDYTQTQSKIAKKKADILLIERKIRNEKQEFGIKFYDFKAAGNEEAAERAFQATKTEVERLEGDIARKKGKIDDMRAGAPAADEPDPLSGAPPPPPPPPSGDLPQGWKSATTPDGKQYYFNEMNGTTSWSIPTE